MVIETKYGIGDKVWVIKREKINFRPDGTYKQGPLYAEEIKIKKIETETLKGSVTSVYYSSKIYSNYTSGEYEEEYLFETEEDANKEIQKLHDVIRNNK